MFAVKQTVYIEIGYKGYPIGRVINLSPDRLTVEVLMQDNLSEIKGLPVHLFCRSIYEGQEESTTVLFDGIVQAVNTASTGNRTSYVVLSAVCGVYDALVNTELLVLKDSESMDDRITKNISSATTSTLIVPESKFMYQELLQKKGEGFNPAHTLLHYIKSVMHMDADNLLTEARHVIAARGALGTGIEKPRQLTFSVVSKAPKGASSKDPGVYREKNAIYIVMPEIKNIGEKLDKEGKKEEDILPVSNLQYKFYKYFVEFKGDLEYTIEKKRDEALTDRDFSSIDDYETLQEVAELEEVEDEDIYEAIGTAVTFDLDFKNFSYSNASAPSYLTAAIEKWCRENEEAAKNAKELNYEDLAKKFSKKAATSSFVRSFTNSGTLKYWNAQAPDKVIDANETGYIKYDPLKSFIAGSRKASMDLIRRRLSFSTEGNLFTLLNNFYNAYFMGLNLAFPMIARNSDVNAESRKAGVIITGIRDYMNFTPSMFTPLPGWFFESFDSVYKADNNDYIFMVKDKTVRELIGDSGSPPYIYDYKKNDMIEVKNQDNIFKEDYFNSFYRTPRIVPIGIDYGVISGILSQKREKPDYADTPAYILENNTIDIEGILKKLFHKRFNEGYELLLNSTALVGTPSFIESDGGLAEFYSLFMEYYVKVEEQVQSMVSPGILADATTEAYIFCTLGNPPIIEAIKAQVEKYKSFYAHAEDIFRGEDSDVQVSVATKVKSPEESILFKIRELYGVSSTSYGGDNDTYAMSGYWKSFKTPVPMLYKAEPAFVHFFNKYLKVVEGTTVNAKDGTLPKPENTVRAVPSYYGLVLDKILSVSNSLGGHNYNLRDMYSMCREYGSKVEVPYNGNKKAPFPAHRFKQEINRIFPVNSDKHKNLFLYMADMTEDEAAETTYRIIYRGVAGSGVNSLYNTDYTRNIPMPVSGILLDILYQHGSFVKRFKGWLRGENPKYPNAYNYSLSPDRRRFWLEGFPNLSAVAEIHPLVFGTNALLQDNNSGGTASVAKDLMQFRKFVFSDVDNPKAYSSRFDKLEAWLKESERSFSTVALSRPVSNRWKNSSVEVRVARAYFYSRFRDRMQGSISGSELLAEAEGDTSITGLTTSMSVISPMYARGLIRSKDTKIKLSNKEGDVEFIKEIKQLRGFFPPDKKELTIKIPSKDKIENEEKELSLLNYIFVASAVEKALTGSGMEALGRTFSPVLESLGVYDSVRSLWEKYRDKWDIKDDGSWIVKSLISKAYCLDYAELALKAMAEELAKEGGSRHGNKGFTGGMDLLKEMMSGLKTIVRSPEVMKRASGEIDTLFSVLPVVPEPDSIADVKSIQVKSVEANTMITTSVEMRSITAVSAGHLAFPPHSAKTIADGFKDGSDDPVTMEGLRLLSILISVALGYRGLPKSPFDSVSYFIKVLCEYDNKFAGIDTSATVEESMFPKLEERESLHSRSRRYIKGYRAGRQGSFWLHTGDRVFSKEGEGFKVIEEELLKLGQVERRNYLAGLIEEVAASKNISNIPELRDAVELWNHIKGNKYQKLKVALFDGGKATNSVAFVYMREDGDAEDKKPFAPFEIHIYNEKGYEFPYRGRL